jgi:hypothetical protein
MNPMQAEGSSGSRSDPAGKTGKEAAAFTWRSVLGRLGPYVGVTLVADTVIAALLTAAMPPSPDLPAHNHFLVNFVYSQFIGLSILLLIVVPRLTFWPRDILLPWQAALHLTAATIIGFVGGSFVASLLLGMPPLIRAREPGDNALLVAALITVLASVGCSTFFWLRERVSALHLEASSQRARAEMELARAETASRQATEAQLNLIRTQLEPHMLFNTLANLRSLMTVDPPRAQLMVDHLISFLRATLAASRHDEVTLREEFNLLRDYLVLISIRMGPRLTFSLHLPAELAPATVLPLLLQPLVENAVRHGIEPAVDGGRIDVKAMSVHGQLKLIVEDTGIGFLQNVTAFQGHAAMGGGERDIRAMVFGRQGGSEGFGLSQIRERLRTAYGEAASLTIESPWLPPDERSGDDRPGRPTGSRVTLILPAAARPGQVAGEPRR